MAPPTAAATSEWTLRFAPSRRTGAWKGLAISVGAIGLAVAIRLLFVGPAGALGIAPTYFPALILAAVYAGPRWGLVALAAQLAMTLLTPTPVRQEMAARFHLMFAVTAVATFGIGLVLREALIRIAELNSTQASVQQALNESQARLRWAQDAGGVGLYDWDMVSGDVYWSPTACKIYGVDPATPPGLGALLNVVHPDDRDLITSTSRRMRGHDRIDSYEHRVVRPDGEVRWVSVRGEVIRNEAGVPQRALGAVIDITDRQFAYEQVQQSEARFRALADSAPVMMWVSRIDGRRGFVNQAYLDYLGDSFEAALEFDWRKRLHPDDLERILREQAAGEASRQRFTLEARYLRADGEYRWLHSVSQPRYDPSGAFEGFVGIGFDVTDAKRAEEDLKRINELLAERVQAALGERDQAEAALRRSQKLEAVGQLTGGVAHDFNNLLTVIIGALDLIQRHPSDAARRERMLEAALGAARRGERLTNQLLAFARRQALKPQLMRVDDLLDESEPLLRRAAGEAVSLVVSPGAPEGVALIDPSQFEAALMNLVVNARDAVTSGGTIRLETQLAQLRADQVEEVPAGDYICVAVHDTGAGMSPEVLTRVFEPFFTTKEVGKGTGLGLSQVYGFARQSGGGVAIESAVGQGASVRLYLPLSKERLQSDDESRGEPPVAQGPALKVLLVEDDAEVGDLVEAMLQDLGHAVSRARNGSEGLEALKGGAPFDLLLTDVVMPGAISGVELAQEATRLRPTLPVILSSGYTGEVLGSAAGAPWPLLRKPYSADSLARTIGDVVKAPQPA